MPQKTMRMVSERIIMQVLVELIQVAYDIEPAKSFKRETSAIVAASDALRCNRLTLVSFAETRDIEISGKTIHIVSAIEWLLK